MFTLRDNAFGPSKARFEEALRRFPAAQEAASQAAAEHLQAHLQQAAVDAHLDPSPIVVVKHGRRSTVALTKDAAGVALADEEFGRPDRAPNPVLRTRRTAVIPEVHAVYRSTLYAGLGF